MQRICWPCAFVLLFHWMIINSVFAQEVDTVKVEKIIHMEMLVDSLRQQIRNMDSEIQRMKKEMVENASDVQQILSFFEEELDFNVPEDQRSRRKRVDALLKAITERPGQLRFNGSAVISLQSFIRNPGENTHSVGSFDLFAHTSFGANTLLFFDFEVVSGNGPSSNSHSLSSLNGDAGSTRSPDGLDRIHLLEAWAEVNVFKKLLTINIGKIDITNYFDNNRIANDETSQFLCAAFVNSSALAAPTNGPGVRFRTTVLNRFFLQGGVSSVTSAGNNLFHEVFKIGSVGLRLFPTTDWEANIRVYGYQHPVAHHAFGWGISYDETVGKAFEVFMRFGRNNPDLSDNFGIVSAWSCGLAWASRLAERKLKIGAAVGEISPKESDQFSEMNLEIFIRHQLNQWSYISVHYQSQSNSAIGKNTSNLIGCRMNFNF